MLHYSHGGEAIESRPARAAGVSGTNKDMGLVQGLRAVTPRSADFLNFQGEPGELRLQESGPAQRDCSWGGEVLNWTVLTVQEDARSACDSQTVGA